MRDSSQYYSFSFLKAHVYHNDEKTQLLEKLKYQLQTASVIV